MARPETEEGRCEIDSPNPFAPFTRKLLPIMCVSEQNHRANASTVALTDESHPVNLFEPNEGTSMGARTPAPKDASRGDQPEWKSEEYHGKHIHVCTVPRINVNERLSGHGQQWDFKVRVTDNGAGPTAPECANAESDPESFYSTQAIAADLGFIKGRELVEGI